MMEIQIKFVDDVHRGATEKRTSTMISRGKQAGTLMRARERERTKRTVNKLKGRKKANRANTSSYDDNPRICR